LTGIPASQHALLAEEELRARFPQEIADLDDAQEAVEILRETLKPANLAVEAELIASGTPVAEPTAPAPAKAWA
jgi:hypothetical protein